MCAFKSNFRRRGDGPLSRLLCDGSRRQINGQVGQRRGARQRPVGTEFHMRMAAALMIAIMRTDLEREGAVRRRHESGRNHRLEHERDQQRAGDEQTVVANAANDGIPRHRTVQKVREWRLSYNQLSPIRG